MKVVRCMAPALLSVVFFGLALPGSARAPDPPQQQDSPAIRPAPAPSQPSSSPTPISPSSGILGLSRTQIGILVVVAAAFIAMALVLRWWLSEPAKPEEEQTPPAPGSQDVPQ